MKKQISLVLVMLTLFVLFSVNVIASEELTVCGHRTSDFEGETEFTIVDGGLSCPSVTYALQIDTDGVTLDCNNETIQRNGGIYGVAILDVDDVTIIDCNIVGFDKGIYALNVQGGLVVDSSFSEGDYGIRFYNSDDIEISSNTFSELNDYGIHMSEAEDNQILSNTFEGTGSDTAIYVGLSNDIYLEDNYIDDFEYGIVLSDLLDIDLQSNHIYNSEVDGISLDNSEGIELEQNYFCYSQNYDFTCEDDVNSITGDYTALNNFTTCLETVDTTGAGATEGLNENEDPVEEEPVEESFCGDGTCDANEDYLSCLADCPFEEIYTGDDFIYSEWEFIEPIQEVFDMSEIYEDMIIQSMAEFEAWLNQLEEQLEEWIIMGSPGPFDPSQSDRDYLESIIDNTIIEIDLGTSYLDIIESLDNGGYNLIEMMEILTYATQNEYLSSATILGYYQDSFSDSLMVGTMSSALYEMGYSADEMAGLWSFYDMDSTQLETVLGEFYSSSLVNTAIVSTTDSLFLESQVNVMEGMGFGLDEISSSFSQRGMTDSVAASFLSDFGYSYSQLETEYSVSSMLEMSAMQSQQEIQNFDNMNLFGMSVSTDVYFFPNDSIYYTCFEADACSDGYDNDGDNLVDCADSQCAFLACGGGNACIGGICTEIILPEASTATVQIETAYIGYLWSYTDIFSWLNSATVYHESGVCDDICVSYSQTCLFANAGRSLCSDEDSEKCTCV